MKRIGIDPGADGALALLDASTGRLVLIWDMPMEKLGTRRRVDLTLLGFMLGMLQDFGAEEAIIEKVGGRPRQGASAAFVFGEGYGAIRMGCRLIGLRCHTVEPGIWKRRLKVPADKAQAIGRANEIFPQDSGLFQNARGTARPDRAEAALLAYHGGDRT